LTLKFGVKMPTSFDHPGEYLADAQALEAAGADSLWLSESLIRPAASQRRYRPSLEPWTLMAGLAAVTRRVRLGTSVSVVAMWPPVMFATMITTLEHLSQGRVIVGAGSGWEPAQFAANGMDFGDRGRRLDEFLELVRRLWSGSDAPFEGEFYSIPAIQLAPPLREGGPPLMVGGFSPPGYRRAANLGDGFIHGGGQPQRVAADFERVLELREAADREGPFELWVQVGPPPGRPEWKETLLAYEDAGATGLIVPMGPGLLDLLRNPDVDDDRADLNMAVG
jgi:alkanesulfonate monooxygenase SsuD/methylene tetrahydromethanopterin reductase-like flavin-dependent oxidoreductase (luciferase family)